MKRILMACLALAGMAAPAVADFPCDELRAEANAKYKDAGYCFKSAEAIEAYGNDGCLYDDMADVPLTRRQRADLADIRRQERENDCPR